MWTLTPVLTKGGVGPHLVFRKAVKNLEYEGKRSLMTKFQPDSLRGHFTFPSGWRCRSAGFGSSRTLVRGTFRNQTEGLGKIPMGKGLARPSPTALRDFSENSSVRWWRSHPWIQRWDGEELTGATFHTNKKFRNRAGSWNEADFQWWWCQWWPRGVQGI